MTSTTVYSKLNGVADRQRQSTKAGAGGQKEVDPNKNGMNDRAVSRPWWTADAIDRSETRKQSSDATTDMDLGGQIRI